MNRFLVWALVFSLMIPVFFAGAQSACLELIGNLRPGSHGAEVLRLQVYLQSQGHLRVAPTGYFGTLTEGAAKNFQAAAGLTADGIVGPITRARIATETCGAVLGTSIGIEAVVSTTTSIGVRPEPYISSPVLGTQAAGASGRIVSGPVSMDGYTWWKVYFSTGANGWVAGEYLE